MLNLWWYTLMTINFPALRGVVFDMDGVLWRGSESLPGVPEFFAFLQQHGIRYVLATNNSTRTVDLYVERLNHFGIPATPDQVMTSAVATADYVSRHYPADTPVYIIGQQGIRDAMAAHGFREDPAHARLVIVGLDFDVRYEHFKTATLLIRAGADFIGTNGDLTFPVPEGLVPGNGSLLALLQAATDRVPTVIGKPEPGMLEVSLERLGTSPVETLMIGDRLETDILGGQRSGLPTALVLTGIATRDEAEVAIARPDGIFESLADLHAAWASALELVGR